MKLATLFCVVFATTALASSDIPAYFGKVKGTLLISLTKRDTFEFTPGKLPNCAHKVVSGSSFKLESFDCKIEGASVKVNGENGEAKDIPIEKLFVFYKYQKNGDIIREYRFTGAFREKSEPIDLSSDVNFVLWYYTSQPTRINGFIELPHYAVAHGLQATDLKE